MSKCDLKIILADPGMAYRPGDLIRGHLEVTVDQDVTCNGLTLTQQWRTHGRGNRDSGPANRITLYQGGWRSGERSTYPFCVPVPAGPATYHGTLLNVDHYLTARADIPWSLDPKAETEFLVACEGAQNYDFGPKHTLVEPDEGPQEIVRLVGSVAVLGCFGLPGLLMLLGGAASLFGRFTNFPGFFIFPLGGIMVGLALAAAYGLNRNAIARQKMGKPRILIAPRSVHPGQPVSVQVTLQPRVGVNVNKSLVELCCRERVVSGSGTSRQTHTHDLYCTRNELGLPTTIGGGQMASAAARLDIPTRPTPSFTAEDNEVRWYVRVTLGLKGWADFQQEYGLSVYP